LGGTVVAGDVFGGRGFKEDLRGVCGEGGGGVMTSIKSIKNIATYLFFIYINNNVGPPTPLNNAHYRGTSFIIDMEAIYAEI
jgi:hypothetical protein